MDLNRQAAKADVVADAVHASATSAAVTVAAMARFVAAMALAGTATATYGDTHYGSHPNIAEAPHMVRSPATRADEAAHLFCRSDDLPPMPAIMRAMLPSR